MASARRTSPGRNLCRARVLGVQRQERISWENEGSLCDSFEAALVKKDTEKEKPSLDELSEVFTLDVFTPTRIDILLSSQRLDVDCHLKKKKRKKRREREQTRSPP